MTTIACAVPTTSTPAPAGKPEPKGTGNEKVDAMNAIGDIPDSLRRQPKAESKEAKVRALRENKANRVPKSHSADLTPASKAKKKAAERTEKQMKGAFKAAATPAPATTQIVQALHGLPTQAIPFKKPSDGAPLPKDPEKREAAVDKLARKEVPAKKKAGGTKMDAIGTLLKRPEGCTTADVLKATGWPAVSMPACARSLGVELIKDKKPGEVTRYRVK